MKILIKKSDIYRHRDQQTFLLALKYCSFFCSQFTCFSHFFITLSQLKNNSSLRFPLKKRRFLWLVVFNGRFQSRIKYLSWNIFWYRFHHHKVHPIVFNLVYNMVHYTKYKYEKSIMKMLRVFCSWLYKVKF